MTTCHMDEVWLNRKFKMATSRLLEHAIIFNISNSIMGPHLSVCVMSSFAHVCEWHDESSFACVWDVLILLCVRCPHLPVCEMSSFSCVWDVLILLYVRCPHLPVCVRCHHLIVCEVSSFAYIVHVWMIWHLNWWKSELQDGHQGLILMKRWLFGLLV